jgi:hypothetical protein
MTKEQFQTQMINWTDSDTDLLNFLNKIWN